MTIIIACTDRLIADDVTSTCCQSFRLAAGKVYHCKHGQFGFAGNGPSRGLSVTELDEVAEDEFFDRLLAHASNHPDNQVIVIDARDQTWVTYAHGGRPFWTLHEKGDPAAIGGYREQWYAYAAKHGWDHYTAIEFCRHINAIHGF